MNINEKNANNENNPEISESSSLTSIKEDNIKKTLKIINIKLKYNIRYIILISFLLIIIFALFFSFKFNFSLNPSISGFYNFNKTELKRHKNESQIYTNKWVVLTTNKKPSNLIKRLIYKSSNDTWKILIIEREENHINSDWEKFIKKTNTNNTIFLSLKDQENLGYQTTKYIPKNSYARKNIGYLYAIEHGAEEIFDTDDNMYFKNNTSKFLKTNLTGYRLFYANNNNSHMINPFLYFGRPDIWPRGFKYRDIDKNNTKDIYTILENRLLCKPLIFNGIMNTPDLDTIYLITKENIYLKGKKINFHNSMPLFYIPGNYAPINSKNTLFLYDVFPSLALPVSVEEKVSDIWRGYLAQRYIWGYNGVAAFQNSETSYRRNYFDIEKEFVKERDLFFNLEKVLNCLESDIDEKSIKYPGLLIIKLIEILVENNILDKGDLDMYKAFLNDLESFGYKYKSDYKIKINSDINNYININPEFVNYIPSIPNIEAFTKGNNNLKLLKHYTIKKRYDDILLIINYNYEFLTKLNEFISNLYEQYFPKMVFITPGNNYSKISNNFTIIECPESNKGYYSYYCIKRVYEKYPLYKGYLFVMDDAFIKIWELENLNFDIPWILTFCNIKTKNWPDDYIREEKLLEKNKNWKNNIKIFYDGDIMGHGISVFYYLPNYFVPDFIKIANEYYNYSIFLELTVPSIYGIIMKPKYQFVHFIGLWDKERNNWKEYLYNAHKQIIIHPIKFSDINNQKEIIKYNQFKNANDY